MERISNVQKCCINENSTKNTCIPFTHIHLLLVFYPICFVQASLLFYSEPTEGGLCISWPFTTKILQFVFPKNRYIFLHNRSMVVNFGKFNINTVLFCNLPCIYITVLWVDSEMSFIALLALPLYSESRVMYCIHLSCLFSLL